MLLAAVFIVLMTFIFIMFNSRNKMNIVLSVYFISIAVIMVASVLYISKTSFYQIVFDVDYRFYKFLLKTKCSFDLAVRLFNVGLGLFMLASVIFIRTFYKLKWILCILLTLPIVVFLYYNDPAVSWKLYIALNSTQSVINNNLIKQYVAVFRNFSNILLFAYMVMPFVCMAIYSLNTKIRKNRQYALIFSLLLSSIDIYIYIFFIKNIFFNNLISASNLIKFPDSIANVPSYSFSAMLIVMVMLMIILVNLRYKPFNNRTIVSAKEIARNNKAMDKNFRMLLHTYKNSFVGIEKLTYMGNEYLKEGNNEKPKEIYDEIGQLCNESINKISRVLDLLRDVDVDFEPFSMYNCIEEALHKVVVGRKIAVNKNYMAENDIVSGDKNHITEVFVNLFMNAVEACAEREEPIIEISTFRENNLIIIEVTDNGCGIDKKDIKKIYKPFYSSKIRSSCGGIGLNYVEKIVEKHHGGISVRSEKDKYTTFQLYFPTIKNKSYAERGLV